MTESSPSNVVELRPGDLSIISEMDVVNPDRILEKNMGRFSKVFIVAIEVGTDDLVLCGSHSTADMYFHLGLGMREIEKIAGS